MPLTTDPNDPRLNQNRPGQQNDVYLVLSDEERAKGFVRPLHRSYKHVGLSPHYPLRDLTPEEKVRHAQWGYVKFEVYPESESPKTGKFWTQEALNETKGCGTVTTMGQTLAETYARDPQFYGATFCVHCGTHKPVSEFIWIDDGTVVGS